MINYYFDNKNKQKPFTHALEANDGSIPPDNALRIEPEFKNGYWPCEENGQWVLLEDNRDKTSYCIETKESETIKYFGPVKSGFTLLEPYQFCKWDGNKWISDTDEKNSFLIKQNQSIKNTLLSEATVKIEILQDAINLNINEQGDTDKLIAWKKYRIQLDKLDLTNIDIKWPEQP